MKRTSFFFALFLCCSLSLSKAEEPMAQYDFSSPKLSPAWSVISGKWDVVDGSLRADQERKHGVTYLRQEGHDYSNVSLRFKFVAPVTEKTNFQLGFCNAERILFSAKFENGTGQLNMPRDKKANRDPTKPYWKSVTLDTQKCDLPTGEWIDLSYRINGDKIVVTCGDTTLKGTHELFATEKDRYRIMATQGVVLIDDVKVGGKKTQTSQP